MLGKVLQSSYKPLLLLYLAQYCTGLLKQGYTILEGFKNPLQSPPQVLCALNRPHSFDSTTLKDSEEFMLSMYPVEDALEEESARHVWKTMLSASVESIEKPERV